MLVDAPFGMIRVSLKVLIPFAVATALITFFLLSRIVKAHRARVTTGAEGLVGSRAVADEDFREDAGEFVGYVQTHGELWRARSRSSIKKSERLEVTGVDGLTLDVEPASGNTGTAKS